MMNVYNHISSRIGHLGLLITKIQTIFRECCFDMTVF